MNATATAAKPQQAEAPAKPAVSLDDIMDATEDMRVQLGKHWGIPPSRIMRYGESFISLHSNCPQDFRVPGEIVAQFLSICNEHELNPARYEVRAFYDYNKGLTTFVMIDGWLTLANRHPQFDGVEFDYERDKEGRIAAVTCDVFRKDRTRPTKARCVYSEWYMPNSPQWRSKPEWMLEQKALKQAIRRAFGFAGIMDDDDVRQMGLLKDEPADEKKPIKTTQGISLGSLKPGEAPPADEYERKPANNRVPPPDEPEAAALDEKINGKREEAPAKRKQAGVAGAAGVVPAGQSSVDGGLVAPGEDSPAKTSVASPASEIIEADVLTASHQVFVRKKGKVTVKRTVAEMDAEDWRDAHDAAQAVLADPNEKPATRSYALGVVNLLEAHPVKPE